MSKTIVPVLCPICGCYAGLADPDFPDTMLDCQQCGAEWVIDDMTIVLDPREV